MSIDSPADGGPPPFSELLAQLPVYVTVCSPARAILWHNRWTLGFGDEQLGSDVTAFMRPEDLPAWARRFRRAADEGLPGAGTCRTDPPDGGPEVRWLYRMTPFRIRGRVEGVIVCSWDADDGPQVAPTSTPDDAECDAFLFSPLSARIVDFLRFKGPAKGLTIGRHLGLVGTGGTQASSKVRALLADLEERGVLANGPLGYHLTPAFQAYHPL